MTTTDKSRADALPPMPSNVAHVMRRIRRCETEAAAQVVLEHFAIQYATIAMARPDEQHEAAPGGDVEARLSFNLTHEQVSALYLLLLRRQRPEFGWMESPLVAIEEALMPAHNAIHDRNFNSMNRKFFGDDRMRLDEASMPDSIEPAPSAPLEGTGNGADAQAIAERCAQFAELYRDEHAGSGNAIEACNDIATACRDYAVAHAARAPRTEVAGAVPIQTGFLTEGRKSEIARKCEVECNASPGTNMWQCAYMAIEETINALAEPHLSTWIAEVCEDADGYKHIEPVIEALDDLPKGMKLYAAPQPPSADAAAAPADERAALVERVLGMFEAWPKDELGPTDEPESQYRFGYNTALEDVLTALDVPPARGSRAAASQPAAAAGQESAAPRPLSDWHEDNGFVVWWTWEGDNWLGEPAWIGTPDDSDWPGYHTHWTPHPAFPGTAAPQPPAQVATRQGLTEALRQAREELSNVEWENDPPARVTDLFSKIDALLEGAKHAD